MFPSIELPQGWGPSWESVPWFGFHAFASIGRVWQLLLACWPRKVLQPRTWVSKMFAEKEHNFGTVARGADTVYKFPVKNIYKQDIELVSVRSSCGCTSPTLEHKLLKTGETGYVVAKFNTRTFDGVHSATLTVDVQWNDNGITRRGERSSASTATSAAMWCSSPARSNSKAVDQGNKSEQQVRVHYAGRRTGRSPTFAARATIWKSSSPRPAASRAA